MKTFIPLTAAQVDEIKQEMQERGTPVRFQINGCTLYNLQTGATHRRGINVIHQTVYWQFTQKTARKIAAWTNATAIFDKRTP